MEHLHVHRGTLGLAWLAFACILGWRFPTMAQTVLVETESFQDTGGWVVDQQFMDQMGSPFLLAHGLGVPVADATTEVTLPATGTYRVFARTRDWVAPWGVPGAPGKFQVLIDGKPLTATFGTEGAQWHWQDGGTVEVAKPEVTLALHDLTGFEGRCDAILLTADLDFVPPNDVAPLDDFRREALGLPKQPEDGGTYDLVVVGGGIAGTAATLAAARLGVKVALIQDRPVLGGNNSSEIRVWLGGTTNHQPYPRVGDIVRELDQAQRGHPGTAEMYEDDKKRGLVDAEGNAMLFLSMRANQVEMDGGRIRAVVTENVVTGRRLRFGGRWFADCTGDGCVGALAGADFDMTLDGHMGRCNLWTVADTGQPTAFPRCPWAVDLSNKPFPEELDRLGKWFWESGFYRDPIQEGERIRDTNFRAMYGAWDALKNVKKRYPNHKLAWAAYVSGKRESRRLLGDVVLTREDVMNGKKYPDGCVPTSWSIDLHLPDPRYDDGFEGDEFLSEAEFTQYPRPYWVPYRCLYSRNVPNLFMAGRDISVTHGALGTVRVMRTTGMMGEIVGMAASLCHEHDVDPRGVYESHLEELRALMTEGVGELDANDGLAPPDWLSNAGDNLARAAKVKVSSNLDAGKYPPANLTDGQLHTWDNGLRWVSEKTMPQHAELRWHEPQTISAARIVSGYREGGGNLSAPLTDFALQRYDGNDWQDLEGATVTGNTLHDWHARFPAVETDRLRLLITASPSDTARIWELELYNPPADQSP